MSVTIEMVTVPDAHGSAMWEVADIKRAAKAVADRKPACGHKISLPRTSHAFADAAKGEGISYDDTDGRRIKMQAWAPAESVRTYWYLVLSGAFPGEMRQATLDAGGKVVSIDPTVYNAQGKRAHVADGSACFRGSYATGAPTFAHKACHGCNVAAVTRYVGRPVKIVVAGNGFGDVVRWGTLREVRDGIAVFDALHDCAGIYDGANHDGNGVEFKIRDLIDFE